MASKPAPKPTPKPMSKPALPDASVAYQSLGNLPVYVTDVHDEIGPDGAAGSMIGTLTEEGAKRVIEALLGSGWKLTHGG